MIPPVNPLTLLWFTSLSLSDHCSRPSISHPSYSLSSLWYILQTANVFLFLMHIWSWHSLIKILKLFPTDYKIKSDWLSSIVNTYLLRMPFCSWAWNTPSGVPPTSPAPPASIYFLCSAPEHLLVGGPWKCLPSQWLPLILRAVGRRIHIIETLRRKPGGWLWMALALNSRGSRKALNSSPVPRIKWRWVRWALAPLLQLWGWEDCLLRREIVHRTRLMLVSLSSLVSMQLNHFKPDSAMTRINVLLTFPSPKSLFTTLSLTVTWGQKTKAEPKKPQSRLAVFGLVMRSSP